MAVQQPNSSVSGYNILFGICLLFILLLVIFNIYRINKLNNKTHNFLDLEEFLRLDQGYKSAYKKIIIDRIMPIMMKMTNDSLKNVMDYYKKNEEDLLKIFDNYLNVAKLAYNDSKKSTIVKFNKDQRLVLNQLDLKTVLSESCKQLNVAKRMYKVNEDTTADDIKNIKCS